MFDHNAFSTYTSVATAGMITSTTTAITAASATIPTRRVQRATRVRDQRSRKDPRLERHAMLPEKRRCHSLLPPESHAHGLAACA
jgi:hypothetical protein